MASMRTKLVVQKISEIIRNVGSKKNLCMGKILREAGYSKQTSLKPKLVTSTKGFQDELAKTMPDITVVKAHAQLLHAVKLKKFLFDSCLSDKEIREMVEGISENKVREIVRGKRGHQTICYYWSPDGLIIDKALDIFYRLKGYYDLNKKPNNNSQLEVKEVWYSNTRTIS